MHITQMGYGDAATCGPCVGHPMDPRTNDLEESDEQILTSLIEDARDALDSAAPHTSLAQAESAARDAGIMLLTVNDVPALLRSCSVISNTQAAEIIKCIGSMLCAQGHDVLSPAIAAVDSAADALGGAN